MNEAIHLDLLVVAAHPDDAELSVGGTLINMARLGYKTGVLDLTHGECGTRGTPEGRALEAAQAARVLMLSLRETLGLGDTQVWLNDESRIRMVRVLRRLRPRVVLTHYWEDPHPDHAHTAGIVREAAHLAGLANYDPETGHDRWRPSAVAHFLFPRTVAPSFVVDISGSHPGKWEAIRCHASQFYDPQSTAPSTRVSTQRFLEEVEARDRYHGALVGAAHGEGLVVREALNIADPVQLLTQPMNMYS